MSTTPEERKKELMHILYAWKTKFRAENGRLPMLTDMDADPAISAEFKEFTEIKKSIADAASASVAPEKAQEQEQPQQEQESQPQQEEENTAAAAVDENKQETQPSSSSTTTIPTSTATNRSERKTELRHILQDWKTKFTAEHGRESQIEDMYADYEFYLLHNEYQNILHIETRIAKKKKKAEYNQQQEQQETSAVDTFTATTTAASASAAPETLDSILTRIRDSTPGEVARQEQQEQEQEQQQQKQQQQAEGEKIV